MDQLTGIIQTHRVFKLSVNAGAPQSAIINGGFLLLLRQGSPKVIISSEYFIFSHCKFFFFCFALLLYTN